MSVLFSKSLRLLKPFPHEGHQAGLALGAGISGFGSFCITFGVLSGISPHMHSTELSPGTCAGLSSWVFASCALPCPFLYPFQFHGFPALPGQGASALWIAACTLHESGYIWGWKVGEQGRCKMMRASPTLLGTGLLQLEWNCSLWVPATISVAAPAPGATGLPEGRVWKNGENKVKEEKREKTHMVVFHSFGI